MEFGTTISGGLVDWTRIALYPGYSPAQLNSNFNPNLNPNPNLTLTLQMYGGANNEVMVRKTQAQP